MKILVGTTSQPLSELLTQQQISAIIKYKDDKKFTLWFSVPGTENVYIEGAGMEATTTDGSLITGINLSISDSQLSEISLISDTADTDVRILPA